MSTCIPTILGKRYASVVRVRPAVVQHSSYFSELCIFIPEEKSTSLRFLVLTCVEPTALVFAFFLHFEVFGREARRAVAMPDTVGEDTSGNCRSRSASIFTTTTTARTIAVVVSALSRLASASAVHFESLLDIIAVPRGNSQRRSKALESSK
jgi:hypothetical protein